MSSCRILDIADNSTTVWASYGKFAEYPPVPANEQKKELNVFRFVLLIPVLFSTCSYALGQSSAELLTSSTKGFVCIPNVEDFQQRWDQTQLGKLASDPVMEPFANDLRDQIRARLLESNLHVSIQWEEVSDVCKSELCLAAIVPEGGEGYASVLILDVAGRRPQAEELIARIGADLAKRGAKKRVMNLSGNELVVHQLPREKGQMESDLVVRFLVNDRLVIGNHEKVCKALANRIISGDVSDSLAASIPFKNTVSRSANIDVGISSQVQWFVEPFGFVKLTREAARDKRGRGKDMLAVFKSQGFDAIKGIGGSTAIKTDQHELLHRLFVYAPPVEGAEAGRKYKLAARMLAFPNGKEWKLPGWIPRDLATFAWLRWKTKDAFEYSGTLVDAVAGGEIFNQVLQDLENDPNGPKVNIRKGLINHLGEDVLIMTDQVLPVTIDSERAMVAVPVANAVEVEATLHKLFDDDPTAKVININGITVWELSEEEDEQLPAIPNPVLNPGAVVAQPNAKAETLTDYSITVANGHMLVASHISLIEDLLKKRAPEETLITSGDYQMIQANLEKIGAGSDCCRFFGRTDEEYRTNYELIRQGKMPQSKTMLGKILNRIMSDPKREIVRKQQLEAQHLPPYQMVRRFLGPSGLFVRTHDDGWEIGGLLLEKRKADNPNAAQVIADPENSVKKSAPANSAASK